MIDKFIIFMLIATLIALPAIGSASMVLDTDAAQLMEGQPMVGMHHDVINDESTTASPDDTKECQQHEMLNCCEDECGCCLAHVYPVSTIIFDAEFFSRSRDNSTILSFPNPEMERLNRPPKYI